LAEGFELFESQARISARIISNAAVAIALATGSPWEKILKLGLTLMITGTTVPGDTESRSFMVTFLL